MEWLNSQPWLRPALGVLVAIAQAVIVLSPPHSTVAKTIAGWVLAAAGGMGAASLGQSSTGLKPADAKAIAPKP